MRASEGGESNRMDTFQFPSGRSLDLSQQEILISIIEHNVTVISE